MQYTLEVEINLPRNQVIELFDNAEHYQDWQPCLVSNELQSGERGHIGAVSKIVNDMNGRKVEMTETVTVRNFPEEYAVIYEAKNVWNLVQNRFEEVSDNKTKWIMFTEFKCSGFMKFMAFFMSGMFKKESQKYMKQFREFAHNHVLV